MLDQITWTPAIGDPSPVGWFTVALYFAVAFISMRVHSNSSEIFSSHVRRQSLFWLGMALVFVLLGLNKQLDLQSLMTDIGRVLAKNQGWYEDRQEVQKLFILAIVISAIFLLFSLTAIFWRVLPSNWLAFLGISLLLAFIGIRASSFHKIDAIINYRIVSVRMNWVLEISAIALVGLNAFCFLKLRKSNHASQKHKA